jgi:hypothetical protein
MKNKILGGIAIFIIAAIAAINVTLSTKNNHLPAISLANVEALAFHELTPNGWTCFQNVRDSGSNLWFIVTYCGNCSSYSATSASGGSYCWFY